MSVADEIRKRAITTAMSRTTLDLPPKEVSINSRPDAPKKKIEEIRISTTPSALTPQTAPALVPTAVPAQPVQQQEKIVMQRPGSTVITPAAVPAQPVQQQEKIVMQRPGSTVITPAAVPAQPVQQQEKIVMQKPSVNPEQQQERIVMQKPQLTMQTEQIYVPKPTPTQPIPVQKEIEIMGIKASTQPIPVEESLKMPKPIERSAPLEIPPVGAGPVLRINPNPVTTNEPSGFDTVTQEFQRPQIGGQTIQNPAEVQGTLTQEFQRPQIGGQVVANPVNSQDTLTTEFQRPQIGGQTIQNPVEAQGNLTQEFQRPQIQEKVVVQKPSFGQLNNHGGMQNPISSQDALTQPIQRVDFMNKPQEPVLKPNYTDTETSQINIFDTISTSVSFVDEKLTPESSATINTSQSSIRDKYGREYAIIPEGIYLIGHKNRPAKAQTPFCLAKHPVTRDEYMRFVQSENIPYTDQELQMMYQASPGGSSPATMVSWWDAKSYCRWLRKMTGEYYALPTIFEWEAAARGTDARLYPWGSNPPTATNCCFKDELCTPASTCPVDFYDNNISPFGCYGMIGNVHEWTLNSFGSEHDPHILKGGAWNSMLDECNTIAPCAAAPTDRLDSSGFRIVYLPGEYYRRYREVHES